jgi:trehalose 6-phosphate synthase
MRGWIPFLAALGATLLALILAASWAVTETSKAWFERDVGLRVLLAVRSGKTTIERAWDRKDTAAIYAQLNEMSRDNRIVGACLCTPAGQPVTCTDAALPPVCTEVLSDKPAEEPGSIEAWHSYSRSSSLYLSGVQLDRPVFVALAHNMAFAESRASYTRNLTLVALGALALAASGITFMFLRYARKSWLLEAKRAVSGQPSHPSYQPLLDDVRALIQGLARDAESGGDWNPVRLKNTLRGHLHGEEIVVLANREPYIHERQKSGEVTVSHPASGLVTALEPVMRACSGTWVAHGAGSADRETADRNGRLQVPPGKNLYNLRRVWLDASEENGYYYGFSNEGLWPLCHLAHVRPEFRAQDWAHYNQVNAKFADAVQQECSQENPIIWVQDYHFTVAPAMIRKRLPGATIIAFWHIPWPNAERFGICPWHKELLSGLLGCDILGFHTQLHCNNFLDAVDRYLEARIDRERHSVIFQGRETNIRPYPISVEWPGAWMENIPSVEECRRSVLRECGLSADALIGVGVDRLDYTKGILERLLSVEKALEQHPELIGRFSFLQLAAPSRSAIPRYRTLAEEVEAAAARINQRFGTDRYRPVVLMRSHHEPPVVYRYYRAADLCYVSSLHDGMNLVAKEFVSARDDERGVLVLSSFTGASRELNEALIVNPYNLEEAGDAMAAALKMSPEEQGERMKSMRSYVARFNVYRWAGRIMLDAAFLRHQERLLSRFGRAS